MSKSAEQKIFALARQILPGAAGVTLTRDSDLQNDLNADSLSLVSLIFAIEEEFGLETSELGALVTESRTIGDLVAAVESRKSSGEIEFGGDGGAVQLEIRAQHAVLGRKRGVGEQHLADRGAFGGF